MPKILLPFEAAIAVDFEATSAVERELELRLASLLWRLRRATGDRKWFVQDPGASLGQFRQTRRTRQESSVIDVLRTGTIADVAEHHTAGDEPTCCLDWLSRYEATLWRRAGQILFTLQFVNTPKPWARMRLR